jgi:hypothetical protein
MEKISKYRVSSRGKGYEGEKMVKRQSSLAVDVANC